MIGVDIIGSFDTPDERKLMSTAKWQITELTTMHWLNDTNTELIPVMPYLSYPRNPNATLKDILHLYFAHLIHTTPGTFISSPFFLPCIILAHHIWYEI
jgi:hypothetical protein